MVTMLWKNCASVILRYFYCLFTATTHRYINITYIHSIHESAVLHFIRRHMYRELWIWILANASLNRYCWRYSNYSLILSDPLFHMFISIQNKRLFSILSMLTFHLFHIFITCKVNLIICLWLWTFFSND